MIQFSSDMRLKVSLGVFILSSLLLTTSYRTTFVFDHPVNSAVLVCILAALILLFLGAPGANSYPSKRSVVSVAEQFESLGLDGPSSAVNHTNGTLLAKKQEWIKVALFSCILCIRIELYRQITVNVECAPAGHGYAIPFLISLYDYFRNQRCRQVEKYLPSSQQPADARLRILHTFYRRSHYYALRSRQRYIISAGLFTLGGLLASSFHKGRASTYICPLVSGEASCIPIFRNISVFLDALLLIGVAEISCEWIQSHEGKRRRISRLWGYVLLAVAAFWTLIGIIMSCSGREGIASVDDRYVRSAMGQGLLMTLLLASAVQLLPRYGILGLCMQAGFVIIYFSLAATLLDGQQPFPLIHSPNAVVAYLGIFATGALFFYARAVSEEEAKFLPKFNIVIRLSLLPLLGVGLIFSLLQPDVANLHPIDLLIFKGRAHHSTWLSQAKASQNLEEAVAEYERRYNQYPPPGFDKWYEYATSRDSVVIDDFDEIYKDLLPFRALTPQRLRELTHQLATNPFNNIGAISIRGGSPKVQKGVKPTHAWMVSAATQMIEKFSGHLPDMDIAFNLDDQPRIAVPWEKVSVLKDTAKSQEPPAEVLNGWSMDRALEWAPIEPADQTKETVFTDSSWRGIFDEYVSLLCPPSSKARSHRIWDRYGICLSCIRPHSMGQFPSDWDLASDICHQPDLAALHGFFISPTAFKVTQELVPLFSQSKISGFSDILYPSPWNYIDKVKYEPSDDSPDLEYDQKNNTLSWIGSTSEGVSHDGGWKGMCRQRFVHLVNNNTLSKVSVLLPTSNPRTYFYQILDGSAPSKDLGLQTAVHVADPVAHCLNDCDVQQRELGTVSRVDFQSNWAYRYLFDLDGAGFSGRFLPFMQSRSLPFKTGLFRQWFDRRITAWLHFVPVDIRLHGLWSTLAYFAGVNGTVSEESRIVGSRSRRVVMEAHDVQGKWISGEGRKWAEQALRKEDMEIYFFRLLLEWGRLTDDHRDLIGFKL